MAYGKPKTILAKCPQCGAERQVRVSRVGRLCKKCSNKKNRKNCLPVHGHAVRSMSSRTYNSWTNMKSRCTRPEHHRFKYYGGRGITVCERWLNSFKNFLEDMGPRPEGKTLDRFPDQNGNYEKSNCRWASATEQANNTRKKGTT